MRARERFEGEGANVRASPLPLFPGTTPPIRTQPAAARRRRPPILSFTLRLFPASFPAIPFQLISKLTLPCELILPPSRTVDTGPRHRHCRRSDPLASLEVDMRHAYWPAHRDAHTHPSQGFFLPHEAERVADRKKISHRVKWAGIMRIY